MKTYVTKLVSGNNMHVFMFQTNLLWKFRFRDID